jgi:ATP/maltotriose-dependent transcriptional regulator MalT
VPNDKNNIEVLRLMGNKVNVRIITLIRRHPMSPRDLSRYLNKKEGDIVRRLKAMEKHGLVKGSWGTRLGENVKLYSLVTHDISVSLRQQGLQISFSKEKRKKPVETNFEPSAISPPSSAEYEEQQTQKEEFPIVGRASELKLIRKSEKANLFFVIGIAGIGKSSFARKYVQESGITGENIFWHTFKEIDTFSYLVSRLALFLSKHGTDDLIEQLDLSSTLGTTRMEDSESHNLEILVKSLNRIKGCILVFDDYHKVRDEKISILLKHMQAKLSPANKTLVLSRSKAPFFLDNIHSREIILGGLTFADSEQVVLHLGADIGDTTLLNIWRRFAGHPMALKLFCMLKKQQTEKNQTRPGDTPHQHNLSIEELLAYFKREILEVLNQDELSILMSLSVFRSPVKIQAISLSVGSNKRNLNYLLYSLEKKMIVSRTANQEFFLHDMLKDVLYSMLAYPEEVHASAARYYLTGQTVQDIMEAIYHLIKARDLHKVISIISEEIEQERYRMLEEGYSGPLLEILSQVSVSAIKDKKSLIYLLNIEGKAYALMEKWQESKERLDQALQIAKMLDAGSSKNIAIAYTKKVIGEALYLKGEFTEVEKHLLEAASIFKGLQMEEPQKGIYMKLARMYFATGRPEKSQHYSDLAMAISAR